MHLGQRPQMPLAHQAGDVAGRFQAIGQGGLGDGQPLGAAARIELVAEAVLVAAGQQPRAGRRAVGPGYVSVGEPHAGSGQRVQVRRGDILAAVEAHVRIAHVIADNDQDVGSLRLRGPAGRRRRQTRRQSKDSDADPGNPARGNEPFRRPWCSLDWCLGSVHGDDLREWVRERTPDRKQTDRVMVTGRNSNRRSGLARSGLTRSGPCTRTSGSPPVEAGRVEFLMFETPRRACSVEGVILH